jgi:hypothetical protein
MTRQVPVLRDYRTSPYFFSAFLRRTIDDATHFGQFNQWPGSLAVTILGERLIHLAGREVAVAAPGWSVLVAGSLLERLTLRMQHLDAERDVFRVLQERTR